MDRLVQKITDYCVVHNIVTADQAPWFRYGIAKRLSTLLVSIPLFAIAIFLTSFEASAVYYLSFALIRRRTNGYHARSWLNCLFVSMAIVALFLGIIYPILTPIVSFWIGTACIILVFILAP